MSNSTLEGPILANWGAGMFYTPGTGVFQALQGGAAEIRKFMRRNAFCAFTLTHKKSCGSHVRPSTIGNAVQIGEAGRKWEFGDGRVAAIPKNQRFVRHQFEYGIGRYDFRVETFAVEKTGMH